MPKNFSVNIDSFQKISVIENAWKPDDYKALLSLMELDEGFESMSASEIQEMCLMSLNDYEPDEAAKYVLTYLFGREITEGKIDQLSHQMAEDCMWEEYSDPFFHKRLFDAYGLLRSAFNGVFPKPTGVQFTVSVTSQNPVALTVFQKSPHAPLVRLLAGGLDEGEILNRLYDEQISGDTFEEAKGILWELKEDLHTDQKVKYTIISSTLWFGALAGVDHFEAQTHPDTTKKIENA